jgi:putative Mg2+ transporter-C (MgtC) family protein
VTRILQGLVAGIGFLGAGCIWKDDTEGRVEGLTTAAGLWLTAAVGAAAGMGREVSALLVGAAGLFALGVLGRWGNGSGSVDPQDEGRAARKR